MVVAKAPLSVLVTILVAVRFAAYGVAATPVAMVTDISGNVHSGDRALALFGELSSGADVAANAGAHVVIVYYESGVEYSYVGPTQFRVGAGGPETLAGKAPAERVLGIVTSVMISPLRLVQTMMILRAGAERPTLKLVTPVDTKLVNPPRVFRWEPVAKGLTYFFELTDERNGKLINVHVEDTAFALPTDVKLEEDVTYIWEVSTSFATGQRVSSWAEFVLLESEQRATLESMKPGPDASFSERVVYATVLEQMEVREEARTLWRALLKERPDNPNLQSLAGE